MLQGLRAQASNEGIQKIPRIPAMGVRLDPAMWMNRLFGALDVTHQPFAGSVVQLREDTPA
tara:strand:+ start:291 stop:473 length:183 start_codon:yes stop_codon:yes gene_type:complete